MEARKITLLVVAIFVVCQVRGMTNEPPKEDGSVFDSGMAHYVKVFNASLTVNPTLRRIKLVPVGACAHSCDLNKDCKSFSYHKLLRMCLLSKNDASEDGIKVTLRTKFDYYQKISKEGQMVVIKGATINKFDHLTKLENISIDRCAGHCMKDVNCKMFEYKEESNRCDLTDLNHEHQILTPSLHKWDYYSLNGVHSLRMFLKVPRGYLQNGKRIKYIKEHNPEECASACLLNNECIAFEIETSTCILLSDDASKSLMVRPHYRRDFYQLQQESGKMNIILGASINGFDYFRTTRSSLDDCLNRCLTTTGCKAIEYKKSNRKCDIANLTHFDMQLEPSRHYWNFFEINGSKNPLAEV
ncbi:hypothetical protein Ahia01_000455600 [Argonauta hians]